MKKRNPFFFRANARRFIDEPNTGDATAVESRVEVVNGEADVMDPRSAFGHEAADRRIRGFGFKEFDQRFARCKSDNGGTVGVLEGHLGQLEDVAIERQDLFE